MYKINENLDRKNTLKIDIYLKVRLPEQQTSFCSFLIDKEIRQTQ